MLTAGLTAQTHPTDTMLNEGTRYKGVSPTIALLQLFYRVRSQNMPILPEGKNYKGTARRLLTTRFSSELAIAAQVCSIMHIYIVHMNGALLLM